MLTKADAEQLCTLMKQNICATPEHLEDDFEDATQSLQAAWSRDNEQRAVSKFTEPPLLVRRIALVGFGGNTQPPDDVWANAGIEKWTLNHGHGLDARWDRLFEFHGRDVIDAESRDQFRGVDQWQTLATEQRRPIYMRSEDASVPCSVRFPIEQFREYFGEGCVKLLFKPYAEMAAAYMLGYAIMRLASLVDVLTDRLGHCEILIYGFELFDDGEYAHQRACFEFYAGYALGAGIRVTVPDESAIFANRGLYEYDTGASAALLNTADKYLGARFDEMKAKFGAAKAKNDDAVAEMQTISGIMQEVEQNRKMVRHLLKGGTY